MTANVIMVNNERFDVTWKREVGYLVKNLENGHEYVVDKERCNCPAFVHGKQRPCKHLRAVHLYFETQVSRDFPSGTSPSPQNPPKEALPTGGVKREFFVERQGKQFVSYAGLLDLAHRTGLQSITTELVQVPSDANGYEAIVKAVVTMSDGRSFTGYGDASPSNVNGVVKHCLLRMAETRAKARALRDAVNIGVASLEEVESEEGVPAPVARKEEAPATEAQIQAIQTLARRANANVKVEGLTREEASHLIRELQKAS
ncbi:MAG TPA: hypothetical protein VKV29_04940 [Chthonomonas sp.]|uniref:hypothetical protein n=1 Tax=Chthonomonas sp. TaxID=2282153 RepID=UPI002B4ACBE2|nr:hypothetical protein [Chthonomonas sp.]HLH79611.1 hypothetical protein [Chthonomonas sp.]